VLSPQPPPPPPATTSTPNVFPPPVKNVPEPFHSAKLCPPELNTYAPCALAKNDEYPWNSLIASGADLPIAADNVRKELLLLLLDNSAFICEIDIVPVGNGII
jgi:hypothetical protein